MKKNLLSISAIVLAVIAIGLTFFHVTPFEFTGDTYIGILATLIGVFVTLLIGYQIYNAIDLRKDISEIRRKSEELDKLIAEQQETSKIQNHKMLEHIHTIGACFRHQQNPVFSMDAFRRQHKALISSLKINEPNCEVIFKNLRIFISKIDSNNFVREENDKRKINDIIEEDQYTIEIDEDEKIIRLDQNFCRIKTEYNTIMKLYRQQIAKIKTNS